MNVNNQRIEANKPDSSENVKRYTVNVIDGKEDMKNILLKLIRCRIDGNYEI